MNGFVRGDLEEHAEKNESRLMQRLRTAHQVGTRESGLGTRESGHRLQRRRNEGSRSARYLGPIYHSNSN